MSIELSLAMAYDALVASRKEALPFRAEAALVADFTRLFVQNLFHLDEREFKNILRANRALHEKADKREKKGKDPFEALRQQIRKQDILGRILERYSSHLGALDCVLDVRATAALIHHILYFQVTAKLPAKVMGCEFGSGTNILSVAATIPFLHQGKRLTIHAFEQSKESRKDGLKICEILLQHSEYKDLIEFHIHPGDITTKGPYQLVKDAEKECGPLALWISETFGYQSAKPLVAENGAECTFVNPAGIPIYNDDLEKKYDPLPLVIDHSCRYFDAFLSKIKEGRILAFPDFITPKVVIDGDKSRLFTADGIWKKLHQLGQPYDMLPPCVPTRWNLTNRSKSPRKRRVKRKHLRR